MELKQENPIWTYLFRRKVDRQSSIYLTLQKVPLFNGISNNELELIRRKLHIRHYRADELIFREDEAGCGMYIVEKGAVRITGKNQSGQEVEYAILGEGEFFGELALVTSSPRKASAFSTQKTTLMGFFEPDLQELIEKHPHLGSKILFQLSRVLGSRLDAMNNRVILLQSQLEGSTNADS